MQFLLENLWYFFKAPYQVMKIFKTPLFASGPLPLTSVCERSLIDACTRGINRVRNVVRSWESIHAEIFEQRCKNLSRFSKEILASKAKKINCWFGVTKVWEIGPGGRMFFLCVGVCVWVYYKSLCLCTIESKARNSNFIPHILRFFPCFIIVRFI